MSDVRTTRSFCRVCTALCGILVDTEGSQVLRVRGDRDHPSSHGYTCSKGRALPKLHHHPQRLEHPLLRVDGALQPVSWEACLDDLGVRLRTIPCPAHQGSVGATRCDVVGYPEFTGIGAIYPGSDQSRG